MSSKRKPKRSLRQTIKAQVQDAYREAILSAAERVFPRHGFHESKLTDIAREAEVSVGTLYNYFESKEDIFQAIRTRGRQRFREELALLVPAADPLEELTALVRLVLGFIEAHRDMFLVAEVLGRSQDEDAKSDERLLLRLIIDLLQRARQAGSLRAEGGLELLALLLTGLLTAVVQAWVAEGGDLVGRTAPVMQLFLDGARFR